jgi:hypothetical protein
LQGQGQLQKTFNNKSADIPYPVDQQGESDVGMIEKPKQKGEKKENCPVHEQCKECTEDWAQRLGSRPADSTEHLGIGVAGTAPRIEQGFSAHQKEFTAPARQGDSSRYSCR